MLFYFIIYVNDFFKYNYRVLYACMQEIPSQICQSQSLMSLLVPKHPIFRPIKTSGPSPGISIVLATPSIGCYEILYKPVFVC